MKLRESAVMSTPDDIEGYVAGLKVTELREELKKLNQPLHGNKAALGQRLRETLEKRKAEGDQGEQEEKEEEEEAEIATGEEANAQEDECEAAESGEAPAEAGEAEKASENIDEENAASETNGGEAKVEEAQNEEEDVPTEQQQEQEEELSGGCALNRVAGCDNCMVVLLCVQ